MEYKDYPIHESMRGYFGRALYFAMQNDEDIYLLTGDLGYGMFDLHKKDFPERFINVGAAEQTLLDVAVGLSLAGKKPFCYSITPFLIYRPFETIRTYINHESCNVKLIGGGRDGDYERDGWSHHAHDVKGFLDQLKEINQYWPSHKEEVDKVVQHMIQSGRPSFLSLKR